MQSGRISIYREMLDESAPVRLQTAPTGGESVYLFLEFTINDPIPPLTLPRPRETVGPSFHQGFW